MYVCVLFDSYGTDLKALVPISTVHITTTFIFVTTNSMGDYELNNEARRYIDRMEC